MAIIKEGGYPLMAGSTVSPWAKQRIESMYKEAGHQFTDKALSFFGGNKYFVAKWFYTCRMPAFEDKTPAELCKTGKISDLEKALSIF